MTDMVTRIETIENGPDSHSRGRQERHPVRAKPPLAS